MKKVKSPKKLKEHPLIQLLFERETPRSTSLSLNQREQPKKGVAFNGDKDNIKDRKIEIVKKYK